LSPINQNVIDPSGFDRSLVKPMLVSGALCSQNKSYPLTFFMDSDAIGYAFIDRTIAKTIGDYLGIAPIKLDRPRNVRGFNGKLDPKPIIYQLLPNLKIGSHKESTVPILITNLGLYAAILDKG